MKQAGKRTGEISDVGSTARRIGHRLAKAGFSLAPHGSPAQNSEYYQRATYSRPNFLDFRGGAQI